MSAVDTDDSWYHRMAERARIRRMQRHAEAYANDPDTEPTVERIAGFEVGISKFTSVSFADGEIELPVIDGGGVSVQWNSSGIYTIDFGEPER